VRNLRQFGESNISDLSNRIELFRHLTVDELNNDINESIFKGLLSDRYDKFIEACDYVNRNKNKIVSISCFIQDGEIYFTYVFKEEIENE
jgi:hypothetical protein